MEKHPVELSPRAARDFENLTETVRLRIASKIRSLANDPSPRGTAIKRLHGFKTPTFRLRAGDYRVVFVVENHKIAVLRIIDRKELERALDTINQRNQ